MKSRTLVLTGFFALAACSPNANHDDASSTSPAAGIIGGKTVATSDTQASTVVHIMAIIPTTQDGQSAVEMESCTGTLIGDQVVLTAGHCVQDVQKAKLATFGSSVTESDLNKALSSGKSLMLIKDASAKVLGIATAVATPKGFVNQGNTILNDIALVKLSAPVSVAIPAAAKVKLDSSGQAKISTSILSMGYGIYEESSGFLGFGASEKDGTLTEKKFVIESPGQFAKTEDFSKEFAYTLTSGETPGDTCHGDSGGPLLMNSGANKTLLGVVSHSIQPSDDDSCTNDFAMVATSVQPFVAWIGTQSSSWNVKLY